MNFTNEIDDLGLLTNPLFQIYDLSFIELITLNYLVNHQGPILRHSLYKEVDGMVKSYKKISTSSFYNSLKKMQDRRFIDIVQSENVNYRKASEVYATEYAKEILGFIFYFLVQFNAGIVEFLEMNLSREIVQITNRESFNSTIVIEPTTSTPLDLLISIVPFTVDTIKSIASISRSIYLLSTDQLFNKFLEEGFEDLAQSRVAEGGTIREADDWFDLIIFPLYRKNINFRGLTYLQILNEAKRLMAEDGYLLVIHLKDLPDQDHYFITVFKKYLEMTDFFVPYDKDDVISDLVDVGFVAEQSFDHHGVSFILATLK